LVFELIDFGFDSPVEVCISDFQGCAVVLSLNDQTFIDFFHLDELLNFGHGIFELAQAIGECREHAQWLN